MRATASSISVQTQALGWKSAGSALVGRSWAFLGRSYGNGGFLRASRWELLTVSVHKQLCGSFEQRLSPIGDAYFLRRWVSWFHVHPDHLPAGHPFDHTVYISEPQSVQIEPKTPFQRKFNLRFFHEENIEPIRQHLIHEWEWRRTLETSHRFQM